MAAGEHARLEVETIVLEGFDDLERILFGEGQVVIRIDEKDLLAGLGGLRGCEFGVVIAWAGGCPEVADTILREACLTWRVL